MLEKALVLIVLLHSTSAQIKDLWSRHDGEIDLETYTRLGDRYIDEDYQGCWAHCFRTDDTEAYEHLKPAYNDIFRAGHEAMRLALMYSVNGTAYLFDSTLSSYHSYKKGLKAEEQAGSIFQFQKDLAVVVSAMLGHDHQNNPGYVVQYDNEKAWSCSGWSCANLQENIQSIQYMKCVETDGKAYQDDKIEAACRVANDMMTESKFKNCSTFLENEMAIAFVNSDMDHNVLRVQHNHGHYHHDHYSSCQAHFKTRLVIGTHAVDEHEMEDWQSPDAYYIYIRDNAYTMEAASILAGCVKASCIDPDDDFQDDIYYNYPQACWQATDDLTVMRTNYSMIHQNRLKGSHYGWAQNF